MSPVSSPVSVSVVDTSPHSSLSGSASLSADHLWSNYDEAKSWLQAKKPPPDIDKAGVFCNDRIDLSEVEVYGYDYGKAPSNISMGPVHAQAIEK